MGADDLSVGEFGLNAVDRSGRHEARMVLFVLKTAPGYVIAGHHAGSERDHRLSHRGVGEGQQFQRLLCARIG